MKATETTHVPGLDEMTVGAPRSAREALQSGAISLEDLRSVPRMRDGRSAMEVLGVLASFAMVPLLYGLYPRWWTAALLSLWSIRNFNSAAQLVHESDHGTLFRDPRLNRLHETADWSFRTNACEIPTDCPQRERAGWTGDWQIFAPTAAFLYDVAGFSTKWLRDLAADQRDDGAVRNFAPDPAPPEAQNNAIKIFLEASAGWGDAAVLVPWAMWRGKPNAFAVSG